MKSILILLHCESNTGYAIGPLERTFYDMAMHLCNGDASRIHFAYPSMKNGPSATLPQEFNQYVIIDAATTDKTNCENAERYIRDHGIDTIFGFDQPLSRPIYKYFRKGGAKHFISYWGAPMSSIFGPFRRMLKRIEVALHRHGPDLYIFESQGMADTAVLGRGIPKNKTSVVYIGVDTHQFEPQPKDANYAYEQFSIPKHRKIFFYSGHMEERKGIPVLMQAANELAAKRSLDDWHLLLLGNKGSEANRYIEMLGNGAKPHVTFGGYRSDIPQIHRGCYAGIIASTGWDSLTCSSIEMQASGLPVLLSNLPGLREAIKNGASGIHFERGNSSDLVEKMIALIDQPNLRDELAKGARNRAISEFSRETQRDSLIRAVATISA